MQHNKELKDEIDNNEIPLFTGNLMRDSSVSEFEKIAEAAKIIEYGIKKLKAKVTSQHRED